MFNSAIKYFVNDVIMLSGVFEGKLRALKTDVLPYAFIEERGVDKIKDNVYDVQKTNLKDLSNNRVWKFECKEPAQVAKIRDEMDRIGIKTYEADIPYVRRLLVDGEYKVNFDGCIVYVDIEMDDSNGMPVNYGHDKIVSIAVYDEKGRGNWYYVNDYDSERQMLEAFISDLEADVKTVFAGWNVEFDCRHLLERTKKLGIKSKWLEYVQSIDLLSRYKSVIKGLESYSLAEISKYEKFEKVKERQKRVCEMTREELEEYNLYDAELCREIDRKYGFTDLECEMAKSVNLTIDMLTPVQIADSLILKRARELGFVLENVKRGVKKGYVGAYIIEPEYGLHEWIAYYDVASMYPSIIVNENIDIDGANGEILPAIIRRLLEERRELKRLYKETGNVKYDVMQNVKKVFANSLYGMFGNEYSRYFNEKKAELVTKKGREIIEKIKSFANEYFGKVVYGDTDSIFISISEVVRDSNKIVDVAKLVEEEINRYIRPYEVKLEAVFRYILFIKSGQKGAKKRYWGITIDGNEIVRGLEVRRSDWCRLAKIVQKEVIKMVFEGRTKEEILKYLADIKNRLYKGEFDEMLVIAKGYRELGEYLVNAPHVRALRKAEEKGYKFVDGKVKYVYTGKDVEPVTWKGIEEFRGKLNYRYYWENQIYAAVKRILDSIDTNKQEVLVYDN